MDPFGLAQERGSFLNGLWDGFKSGHELMLTIISAPGNALRNLILALGNGDYKNAPGDFVKGLTGEKQTSVMDLGVSKEKQQEFYNNHPILYQLSDSTLSMIDPSMFIGGGGMKSAMGSKATINYSDDIAKFALNYSDEAAEVVIKNNDDIIRGAGKTDWMLNKGYKPQHGERTIEGFIKNNVSADAEVGLYTKSPGFNNNPKGIGGQFKRIGVGEHEGLSPHVHQPIRNVAPNGNIYGNTGRLTSNGGVTSPTQLYVKQLYDNLFNNKYRP